MSNKIIEQDLENILSQHLPWKNFYNKTILISGANGFIPSYLVETLLLLNKKKGGDCVKILALVRNENKALERFSQYKNNDNFNLLIQDVCQPIKITSSIDFIIHAASQASPKYYGIDPVGTLSANVLGTYNLLELAREKNVKGFLFFSSGEIYGKRDNENKIIDENSYGIVNPTDIRSCYAESKRIGETMCISWWHQYGVPVKIVRPFHTYGPGISFTDGRVYADFVSNIVNNKNLIMKSDGRIRRSFCYLADAVIGFFAVLLKGKNGEVYNVSNNNGEISIRNLATLLVNLFPKKNLRIVKSIRKKSEKYIEGQITRNKVNSSKLMSLGWKPKYSLKEGFKRTILSFDY